METVELGASPSSNEIQVRRRRDSLAVSEDRYDQFFRPPIRLDGTHVKRVGRVDDDAVVGRRRHVLVVDHVGPETAGPVDEAAYAEHSGYRDLGAVLRQLDRVPPASGRIAEGRELVDGAQGRLVEAGVEPGSNAPDVDASSLGPKRGDGVFVEVVRGNDLGLGQPGLVEHPPGFDREVGKVARVEPDGGQRPARGRQTQTGGDGVAHAGKGLVRVHEQGDVVRLSVGVRVERALLVVEDLDPRMSVRAAHRYAE